MITVAVKIGRREMAFIKIENLEDSTDPELGNYSIRFGVDTGEGYAVYQRQIESFPRKKYNTLALLRQALATLEEKELTLDGDPDAPRPRGDGPVPGDLARRLRGAL